MENKRFSVFLFIFFFIPGLLATVTIGANIYQKNYLSTLIISLAAVLSCILGLLYKDKIIKKLSDLNTGLSEGK